MSTPICSPSFLREMRIRERKGTETWIEEKYESRNEWTSEVWEKMSPMHLSRIQKTEMKKQKDVTLRRQLCYWVFHSDSPLVGYTWTIFSFCWIKNTFDGYTWNIFSFCRIEKYLHESVSGFSSRHVFFELLLPVQSIIAKLYLDIIF